MALCVDGGTRRQNTNGAKPTLFSRDKKCTTLLQILNASLSPSMVDMLIHFNSTTGRKDCEGTIGDSPAKAFFTDQRHHLRISQNWQTMHKSLTQAKMKMSDLTHLVKTASSTCVILPSRHTRLLSTTSVVL